MSQAVGEGNFPYFQQCIKLTWSYSLLDLDYLIMAKEVSVQSLPLTPYNAVRAAHMVQ